MFQNHGCGSVTMMKSIQSRRVTKAGVINAYFNAKLQYHNH